MRAVFVGGGKMAEAMINGMQRMLPASGAANGAFEVEVCDPNESRADVFSKQGITTWSNAREALGDGRVSRFDAVVLAIKPQTFDDISNELTDLLDSSSLVVSIMAGQQIDTLQSRLLHDCVVRAMPNTPAAIGEGMTVWCPASRVTAPQLEATAQLLGAFGRQLRADKEDYLDMATALSGTGPAYYFLAMEAMVDAGVHMGLPRDMARTMVEQTMLGAVKYGQESQLHPAVLRNDITSPGGTTASAMASAERGNFRTVLSDAVWAAYKRSVVIGGGKSKLEQYRY